jgi:hypothetical protein
MKTQLYKIALLAALGLAGATAAQAANNDLLLGFNDAAGPAAAQNDYVIDLGAYGNFTSTVSLSFSIDSPTFATAFSADANALNDVAVGAAQGVLGNPGQLLQTGTLNPAVPTVVEVKNSVADITGVSVGEYSSANANGWSSLIAVSPFAPGSTIAGTSLASETGNPMSLLVGGVASLTLWQNVLTTHGLTTTASGWSQLGTLSINANNGVDTVSFTGVSAVPEPTTYSLLGGAGLLLLGLRRPFRRKNA